MRALRLLAALTVVVAVLALASCSEEMFDNQSDLVVFNDSACQLTIWVDGREGFGVRPNSDRTLDDIGKGRHVLEAIDPRGSVVERRTIELAPGEDYYWTIEHC